MGKTIVNTILKRINAKELRFAKFRISVNYKNNCVVITRYKKILVICYNIGMDMYDIKEYINLKLKKTLKNMFGYELQHVISDFFRFEYIIKGIF